jgi:predicted permease
MESMIRDMRHALRTMRRNPGFALVVVLTLALGIGANTAIFSVVRATLLEPLPYRDADEVVTLTVSWTEEGSGRGRSAGHGLSEPELIDFRDGVQSFTGIGAYWFTPANVTGDDEPERVQAAVATPEVFSLLGTEPVRGRWFSEDEGRPGGNQVAILSHAFWSRRYGADASVIGRDVVLNGTPRTVVGIMPPDFALPHAYGDAARTQLWVPMPLDPANLNGRGSHYLFAVARLRDSRSLQQAESELVAVGRTLTEAGHYRPEAQFAGGATPVRELVLGTIQPVLVVLSVAVGFLLLLACANVANLLLARAEGRQRELALRTAIGAGRGALVRQLLSESVVFGLIGGIAGVALAFGGIRALVAMRP